MKERNIEMERASKRAGVSEQEREKLSEVGERGRASGKDRKRWGEREKERVNVYLGYSS